MAKKTLKKSPAKNLTQTSSKSGGVPHRFPSPDPNPMFTSKWNTFIDFIVDREGFHPSHLESLEMLCDLYAQKKNLQDFIAKNGMTYTAKTSQGDLFRPRPEMQLLSKVTTMIKDYTRMLDLFPKKDKGNTPPPGTEEEWA